MELKKEKEGEKDEEKGKEEEEEVKTTKIRTGKSCKGTLYYSSLLKSKGRNPRCVGFTRSLNQVPNYIVSESEVEASKEGRNLTYFKYACVGYSVYLDNNDTPPTGNLNPRAELPGCAGLELVVDKRRVDSHSVHTPAHVPRVPNKEEDRVLPQSRPQKPSHPVGDEFLTRFTRNAGLVASGVARNMRKVGNYVKESVDDILYPYRRRPK